MSQRPYESLPVMKLVTANELYRSESGHTMAREYDTLTPNGNRVAGRWVLRDPSGAYVDFDHYQHDLMERHGFRPSY